MISQNAPQNQHTCDPWWYHEITMRTLLEHLLVNHPADATKTLAALKSGELSIAATNAASLIHKATRSINLAKSSREMAGHQAQTIESFVELTKLLSDHGFDPWTPDHEGGSLSTHDLLANALALGNAGFVKWLLEHPSSPIGMLEGSPQDLTKIHNLAFIATANAPMLSLLLEMGLDPDVVDQNGNTLLHEAKNSAVVDVLVKAGLRGDARNLANEDVLQAWDKKNLLGDERKSMERLLSTRTPTDPERIMRELGKSLLEVGIQQTKQRLTMAGLDPSTMQLNGLTPVEIVIGEALSRRFSTQTYVTGSSTHRKWRKIVLAALRMQGCIDQEDSSPKARRVQQAVALFLAMDRRNRTLQADRYEQEQHQKKVQKAKKQGKPLPTADTSEKDLLEACGLSHVVSVPSFISNQPDKGRWMANWFKRMQDAGAFRANTSYVAINLLSMGSKWSEKSETAFHELLVAAARHQWDPNYEGDRLYKDKKNEVDATFQLIENIMARPGGMGSLMIFHSLNARSLPFPRNRALDDDVEAALSLPDPALDWALEHSLFATSAPDFCREVGAVRQSAQLYTNTSPSATRPGPRRRL